MQRWVEVKNKLVAEREKINVKPPIDLQKLYAGILPYNAGSMGQYFSTIVMLSATITMYHGGPGTSLGMYKFLKDKSFTLEQCKKIFLWQGNGFNTMFAGYAGLEKLYELTQEVFGCLDELKDKEEMFQLMVAYYNYTTKLASWCHQLFPWSLGLKAFRKKTPEEIKELAKLYTEAANKL